MNNAYQFLLKITLISLILSAIPLVPNFLMPIWILLFYTYWMIKFNIKTPAIFALFIGLFFDVLQGDLLGQNSLALILSSLFILKVKQSFSFSNTSTEQVYLFISSAIYFFILYITHMIYIKSLYINWYLLATLITTPLCWPLVKWIAGFIDKKNHANQ